MSYNPEPRYRELLRAETRWDRQRQRKAELDINRAGLGELLHEVQQIENVSVQEIKGLTSRIKRRKHADCKDLIKLSYGFQQSAANISEFIRITGAINVLVKEFTGHDSDLQLLAAECLCNLTLGDDVCCEKVATFAGTYLITFLENMNNRRLMHLCIWTLQNIVSSGKKSLHILHLQGISATLIHILEEVDDDGLIPEILLTFSLILDYDRLFLTKEQLLINILPLITSKCPQIETLKVCYQALVITNFETLDSSTDLQITRHCLQFMASASHDSNDDLGILLSIRVLANLLPKADYNTELMLQECRKMQYSLKNSFNLYASNGHIVLCREMLWLLGNTYKAAPVQLREEYLLYDNFIEGITVPKVLLI